MDARRTLPILRDHAADEITQLGLDPGTPGLT